jgi:hypothetical protein
MKPREGISRLAVIGLVVGGLAVVAAVVLFAAGEDLFGSDPGTIDGYNRDVLESCDLPEDSTLVRTYVLRVSDSAGGSVRTMSYIWASPLSAEEVADFYGAPGPGVWTDVSDRRACRFGQRPLALVLERWIEGGDPMDESTQTIGPSDTVAAEFWAGEGAEITEIATVPDNARSFMLLRLGQREVDGVFGLAPAAVDQQEAA